MSEKDKKDTLPVIMQEIAEEKEYICVDIDDDVARHVNLGLSSGLGMALEIIDKHIKQIERSDTE